MPHRCEWRDHRGRGCWQDCERGARRYYHHAKNARALWLAAGPNPLHFPDDWSVIKLGDRERRLAQFEDEVMLDKRRRPRR